jgi:hypothetical protein
MAMAAMIDTAENRQNSTDCITRPFRLVKFDFVDAAYVQSPGLVTDDEPMNERCGSAILFEEKILVPEKLVSVFYTHFEFRGKNNRVRGTGVLTVTTEDTTTSVNFVRGGVSFPDRHGIVLGIFFTLNKNRIDGTISTAESTSDTEFQILIILFKDVPSSVPVGTFPHFVGIIHG